MILKKYTKSKTLRLIETVEAENERLKNSGIRANSIDDWLKHCNELRAEAYKEFAEKMKCVIPGIDDTYIESIVEDYIDNLLKELVGDK